MLKLPASREEASEIYLKRRNQKRAYLKYDMLLGALVCCNEEEFENRMIDCTGAIGGIPCMCRYYHDTNNICNDIYCSDATQETMKLKWNEELYDYMCFERDN